MKIDEINIRDPYILLHEDIYYLYGTRADTCWGKATGFDCYRSEDLTEWEGPFEIFKKTEDFWADQNYWAPECYFYADRFYFVTTFGKEKHKGIQILHAESPLGPFVPVADGPVTPDSWNCIDGTLFLEEKPYLIFSHSFEDTESGGQMCMLELSEDLTKAISDVTPLFSAKEAQWAVPIPFAKQEFGIDEEVYFTDGPTVHRLKNDGILIIWSSWGTKGYSVGTAISDSGLLAGPWRHCEEKFFEGDGGHGMLFTTKEGQLKYVLHSPNESGKEHPVFFDVSEMQDTLALNK